MCVDGVSRLWSPTISCESSCDRRGQFLQWIVGRSRHRWRISVYVIQEFKIHVVWLFGPLSVFVYICNYAWFTASHYVLGTLYFAWVLLFSHTVFDDYRVEFSRQRRNLGPSVTVFRMKQATDKRKYHSKPQRVPYILPKFGELALKWLRFISSFSPTLAFSSLPKCQHRGHWTDSQPDFATGQWVICACKRFGGSLPLKWGPKLLIAGDFSMANKHEYIRNRASCRQMETVF